MLYRFQAADTATDLDGQVRPGGGNRRDHLAVDRLTGERAVEIHQVQPPATRRHPAPGHRHRFVGKDRAVFHQALAQAYALAILEIDRGNNQHWPFHSRKLRNSLSPAVWLFSG